MRELEFCIWRIRLPADPMLADQTPPDPDTQLHDAEESSVTHLRVKITRLGEEAVRGQQKIKLRSRPESTSVLFIRITFVLG